MLVFDTVYSPDTWPFFLEWERRAVRPVTMVARIAPYLRYYSSHRPTDYHGSQPTVLVVFEDEIAQTHFLRVARGRWHARGRGSTPSLPQEPAGEGRAAGKGVDQDRRIEPRPCLGAMPQCNRPHHSTHVCETSNTDEVSGTCLP